MVKAKVIKDITVKYVLPLAISGVQMYLNKQNMQEMVKKELPKILKKGHH